LKSFSGWNSEVGMYLVSIWTRKTFQCRIIFGQWKVANFEHFEFCTKIWWTTTKNSLTQMTVAVTTFWLNEKKKKCQNFVPGGCHCKVQSLSKTQIMFYLEDNGLNILQLWCQIKATFKILVKISNLIQFYTLALFSLSIIHFFWKIQTTVIIISWFSKR
jgi:hypothetical protein